MHALTIHNMDASLYAGITSLAEREDLSLNQAVKRLLRQALGLVAQPKPAKNDFSQFLGIWSKAESEAFNSCVARAIDEDEWK